MLFRSTIRWLPAGGYAEAIAGSIARFLAEHSLMPGETIMVGRNDADLAAAEAAGLAVFKWATDYYAGA